MRVTPALLKCSMATTFDPVARILAGDVVSKPSCGKFPEWQLLPPAEQLGVKIAVCSTERFGEIGEQAAVGVGLVEASSLLPPPLQPAMSATEEAAQNMPIRPF